MDLKKKKSGNLHSIFVAVQLFHSKVITLNLRSSAIVSFKEKLQTSFFHCNFALYPSFSKVTYTPHPYSAYTLCFPSFRCLFFSKTSLESIPLDNDKAVFCKKQSYCVSYLSMFALGVDNQF